jgi:holliday junction DNA helicase RuvA
MYKYIIGKVTEIESNHITLDNSGIGYLVNTPNPYAFVMDNEYKVYIYEHVREDEHSLYGFKEKEERDMFLKLIEVKGVGCKMALPMLATGSIDGIIDAIERENILYLKKFPKIGDKVARQIILDLKGKFGFVTNIKVKGSSNDELSDVLKGLGYKQPDINRILPNIDINKKIEDQIKEALKLLLK